MFDVPSDAVACAVAVQRAAERHNERGLDRLDLRIGIQFGEASESTAVSENGDYLAPPAIQARQLCDAAQGGQILVSDVVSFIARSEASHTFERAGLIQVDGAVTPWPTFEVVLQGVPSERPPLPAELAARPAGRCSFVGRGQERDQLRRIWAAAADGERRLVFVMGEPGIGKSRLASEFAAEAHADGAVVLSGRSFEESVVPYQPFVEALRQYVADCDPIDLEVQLGGDPGALVALVPEIASRVSVGASSSDGIDRYRLFDTVAAFLSMISTTSPVLLVLDDLQWADQATLLLLKHIVMDPRPASILIFGMYREAEVMAAHPLSLLQADIERDLAVDRLALTGLGGGDVVDMFDQMIGWSPPASVAEGLCADTAGNPFFLQEVIAQLDETGVAADRERLAQGNLVSGEFGVPTRVRDFVSRRMQRLSAPTLEALAVASVVGTEFRLDVLATVLSTDEDRLVDRLDEAVEARLVVEVPGQMGTYAFAHALVQQVLDEGHGANRRASLHARVAEAIESLRPDDPSTLSELARHYALTAGRYAEKVVHYGTLAGDRALAGLAYEDAVAEYTRALDALPLVASADELAKADLLVRLGEARVRVGDERWQESYLAAAEHCHGEESSEVLARAALGYGGTVTFGGVFDSFLQVDDVLVSLLERALAACPSGDDPVRVRLLGRLATALYWSDDREHMIALSQEAIDVARRIGDPAAVAYTLGSRRVALWGPGHVPEMRAVAEEMLAIGESLHDRDIQLEAYAWLISDALTTDPLETADEYIAAYTLLAEELGQPYHLGYATVIQAMRAHLEGRFDDMMRLTQLTADRSASYAAVGGLVESVHSMMLQFDLGRIDDNLIQGISNVAALPRFNVWRSALALAYAQLNRREEALVELAAFTQDGFAAIPKDALWSTALSMLSQVVARVDAVEYARPLYDLQLPYADCNCLMGGGVLCLGPTSQFLGMLATTLGEPDRALAHLEAALERSVDLGSPPNEARVKVQMVRALLMRGLDGDRLRAGSLLEESLEIAAELGMDGLTREIGDLSTALADGADPRSWSDELDGFPGRGAHGRRLGGAYRAELNVANPVPMAPGRVRSHRHDPRRLRRLPFCGLPARRVKLAAG